MPQRQLCCAFGSRPPRAVPKPKLFRNREFGFPEPNIPVAAKAVRRELSFISAILSGLENWWHGFWISVPRGDGPRLYSESRIESHPQSHPLTMGHKRKQQLLRYS